MEYRNNDLKSMFVFIFCSLCIYAMCIYAMRLSPVHAQPYYPYQSTTPYISPFFNQGETWMGNFFDSPQYPMGIWGSVNRDLNPDIGYMPSFFSSGKTQANEMVKGELLVQFSDQYQINQGNMLKDMGIFEMRPSMSGEFYVVKFPEDRDMFEVQKAFEALPGIEFAEPNLIRRAHATMPGSYTPGMGGNWWPTQSNILQTWNGFAPQDMQSTLNSSFFSSYPGFEFTPVWQNQSSFLARPPFPIW